MCDFFAFNKQTYVRYLVIVIFSFVCTFPLYGQDSINNLTDHNATEISLNGTWKFYASNNINEADILSSNFEEWDTLRVPGNWDTRKRYAEYVGKGYYKKTFKIPSSWRKKQIRIKFDAVYETSKVWINGVYVGKHVGGYTPFELNITKNLHFKKENTLVIMADNQYKRGAWWAWGGISRDVTLLADNDIRIAYQHISAVPNFDTKSVNFSITYLLQSTRAKKTTINLIAEITGIYKDSVRVAIENRGETTYSLTFNKPLSAIALWHFDSPNLYTLSSTITTESTVLDVASDNFGVRKFEVKGEQFYLNNQAVRMNGVNRVHDHPTYGNTEPYALLKKDMLDIKSLGCNFSRLMHAPLAKDLLKICDSIGFLVVEEIPVWGDDDPQSFENNPQTKQWLKEMINRDYNHPSVVAWSVGNELRNQGKDWKNKALTTQQYKYVNSMLDYVDSLDKTRLKTYVSITTYRKGDIGTEPYEKLDFLSINSYGNAIDAVKKTHQKFPGKPIFISEIGLGQIGPAPDAILSDRLVGYLNALQQFPYVTGISIWSYNDYRSNYKGTPASGFREWGIVDENRTKKKAYFQLKEIYENWKEKGVKEKTNTLDSLK